MSTAAAIAQIIWIIALLGGAPKEQQYKEQQVQQEQTQEQQVLKLIETEIKLNERKDHGN